MEITNQQINTSIVVILFAVAIIVTIAYCSKLPTVPTCEEQGGTMKLIGYERIHGSGKWLHAKYKCELRITNVN